MAASGLTFVALSPTRWTATGSIVVLPRPGLNEAQLAGYYETLSRGQMVATFAEILRLQRFEVAAGERLALDATRRDVDVSVQVVPDTAVVRMTATATSPRLAESFADSVLSQATDYIRILPQPYAAQVLSPAKGTARDRGLPKAAFAAVILLVAGIGGLLTQQALQWVSADRGWSERAPFEGNALERDPEAMGSEWVSGR